ncbi:MAG: hypothetical protein AB2807_11830, partial [Candidatus Sedimenticola endophacoides]
MLWQILGIVFPIFAIVLAGFLYARRHAPDMAAANKVTIDAFIPALIFDVLQECRYLVKDFGTSQSPKSTRQRDSRYCP